VEPAFWCLLQEEGDERLLDRLAELVDRLDRAPASVLDAAGGLFDRRVAPDQVDVRPSGRHLNGDR